ncbi:MAG: sugar phosphate nucleotidyltransferase [Alphaproteobacteria bacterium]
MTALERHADLLCGPDLPIRAAVARIDAVPRYLFQIVMDAEGRVLGTLTDGDVRRAMLRGVGLDEPVVRAMHAPPVTGRPGEDAANRAKLARTLFLPIVDAAGRLVDVLSSRRGHGQMPRALVMAGGFGTRLGARTRETPKPLIEVAERPILERVLAQLEDAGVAEIHVAVHYLAERIEGYLANRNHRADIRLVREREPLGTAGAIGLLDAPAREPLLVVNGDVLSRVDYAALHGFHAGHGYDGTVAAAQYEVEVPYGVLRHGEDGLLDGIDEKPRYHYFVAAGIYCLAPEICALVPRGRPADMPDLLTEARRAGLRIGVFPVHEYWKDVGQPADLDAAEADHAERGGR